MAPQQAQKALDNSLYVLSAYHDGELVGMGRLVGDGAVICYIQDLIVVPNIQAHGIGSMIIERLIAYAASLGFPGTTMMLDLMCAKGRKPLPKAWLYRPSHGRARPRHDSIFRTIAHWKGAVFHANQRRLVRFGRYTHRHQ